MMNEEMMDFDGEELASPAGASAAPGCQSDAVEQELSAHCVRILELMGENPEREGLLRTPLRVARAMQYLTSGYGQDPVAILTSAKFSEEYRQMVIGRDINFYSLCEHHMLPF